VDEGATDEQMTAIVDVFTGKKGGPLADLAALVGEELEARRAPVTFELDQGKGTLRVGDAIEAIMEPYRSPSGEVTTLNESIFSTIPGSPAYVAKAETFRLRNAELGLDVNLRDHNAIQGSFRFEG
jgi:hypothetical protein